MADVGSGEALQLEVVGIQRQPYYTIQKEETILVPGSLRKRPVYAGSLCRKNYRAIGPAIETRGCGRLDQSLDSSDQLRLTTVPRQPSGQNVFHDFFLSRNVLYAISKG